MRDAARTLALLPGEVEPSPSQEAIRIRQLEQELAMTRTALRHARQGCDGAADERERNLRLEHDELVRSNEELSRFGFVCSHDLKEPVRLIRSMSALLLEEEANADPDQTHHLLQRINTTSVRLGELIDNLLAYSRVNACIDCGPVELDRVAIEVYENLAGVITERGATLECEALPVVHGAKIHFVQLLQNLVCNAIGHGGSVAPRVRIHAPACAEGTVLIVEDNGPGIAIADRDRVFAMFTRLHLDAGKEGTGLGLSICQRIVQRYGGAIECVDSMLGGAAFRISLPPGPEQDASRV